MSLLLVIALTACNKGTKKTDSNNSKDAAQQQSSSSTFEESSKQESSTVNEFTWSASEVKGNTSSDFTVTEGDPRKSGIMASRNVMINQFNDTVANNTIACALVLPRSYDSSKKYPVFLYLHGVGVEGNDGERHLSLLSLMRSNAPEYLDEAILVAPQCPQGMHWQVHGERGEYTGALASVKRLIDKIAEEYSCDKSRYYAIGYSYGGYGVLSLVDNYSNYFAAVHVIAGWYNSSSVRNLANTSIWFHHGTADNIVSPENSKELYRALKEYGAKDVKISLYEGVEHDSYNDSLGNIDNYTWMFSKTK